jgi:hypothetical protein
MKFGEGTSPTLMERPDSFSPIFSPPSDDLVRNPETTHLLLDFSDGFGDRAIRQQTGSTAHAPNDRLLPLPCAREWHSCIISQFDIEEMICTSPTHLKRRYAANSYKLTANDDLSSGTVTTTKGAPHQNTHWCCHFRSTTVNDLL